MDELFAKAPGISEEIARLHARLVAKGTLASIGHTCAARAVTFKSTQLHVIDKTTSKLDGELSFLGISKPVTLDITMNGTMESHPFKGVAAIGFSAKTTIQRKDWGLVKNLPIIGNDVQIEIEGEFLAKN